jgi:hypothetical protein
MTTSAIKLTINDFHAIENARCRNDVEYFVEGYTKIEDRDSEELAIPFKLWNRQKEVLRSFLSDRLVQVLKARQLGLTWLALSYCVWCMIYKSGFSVLALSKTEKDAKELARRVTFILRNLPEWVISSKEWDSTIFDVTILKHKEHSTFQSFPASQDSGRSFTANIVLLDEWAFQQWAREIWRASFPSINRPNGGQVIGLSTIERGTLFEDLWLDDESGFKKIFLPWNSDPRRTQDWYDKTRAAMKDGTMSEYPATEAEAFAIPGGAFFSEFRSNIHLKEPIKEVPSWYARYRVLDYGLDMLACYWIYLDPQGFGRIYKEVHKEGLVISQAVYEILKESGADVPKTVQAWDALTSREKQDISKTQKDKINATYAPPDLFAKASATGKSNSEVWWENGIHLTKTKNDFEQGCLAMSEWLHPIETKDEQTGKSYTTAKLTIDNSAAPKLAYSLLNIQKDKHNPKVYSKQPHILTHPVDAIRYFALEHTYMSGEPQGKVIYTNENDWIKATIFDRIKKLAGRPKEAAQAI